MSLQTSIEAQITALDARLSSISPTNVGSDGTTVTNPDWIALSNQRLKLEQIYTRITRTAPMMVRGVVRGLR